MYGQGSRRSPAIEVGEAASSSAARVSVVEHPQDPSSEPTGQIQEVEVLDLRRESTDLARERGQERVAERGLRVDQSIEGVPVQDVGRHGLEGDRRRRSRSPIEQRELAEEPARADRRQDRGLGAVIGGQGDLDLAVGDDEQRVARVTGMEDRLVAPEASWPQGRRHEGQRIPRRGRGRVDTHEAPRARRTGQQRGGPWNPSYAWARGVRRRDASAARHRAHRVHAHDDRAARVEGEFEADLAATQEFAQQDALACREVPRRRGRSPGEPG